jgi:hypothetical protein
LMRTWLQRVELQRFGAVVFGFGDAGTLATPCFGKIRWSDVVIRCSDGGGGRLSALTSVETWRW